MKTRGSRQGMGLILQSRKDLINHSRRIEDSKGWCRNIFSWRKSRISTAFTARYHQQNAAAELRAPIISRKVAAALAPIFRP